MPAVFGPSLRALLPALPVALAWAVAAPVPARAEPRAAPAAAAPGCDGDTAARLRFLEARLAADRSYADLWWKSWTSVFVAGVVVQGARAGLEGDRGERADLVVSAAKAGIGLARTVWRPPSARRGADELRELPTGTPEACAARLALAEAILRRNAAESAARRRSWVPHLANLGLNLAGALIVAEGFDEPDGWVSGALGFAVGEVQIWSHPWQAGTALADYERRFPASGVPRAPPRTWHLEPWGAGLRITFRH